MSGVIDAVLPPQDLAGKSVVISGSRSWRYPNMVIRLVQALGAAPVKEVLVGFDPKKRTPRGVDMLVWDACQEYGIKVRSFAPVWLNAKGKVNYGAGIVRNVEMINAGDLVIACWESKLPAEPSRGTAHAIVYAHQVGKLYRIYSPPDAEQSAILLLKKAYDLRRVKFPEPFIETAETHESIEPEGTSTPQDTADRLVTG